MPEPSGLVHRTVPPRTGAPPHPALILLHGRGSNELDLLGLAPALDPRFFVVSVRAPYAWMGGYRWYDLEGPGRADPSSFLNSLAQLRSFVNEIAEAYPVDSTRLFLLGFSQGSMMANALTLTTPATVAGAVLLSGFQPEPAGLEVDAAGVRGKPIFVAHGTFDSLLPLAMGHQVRDRLTELGADLTYREYEIDHQISELELNDIDSWLRTRLDES